MWLNSVFEPRDIFGEGPSNVRDLEGVQEGIDEAVQIKRRGYVHQHVPLCVVIHVVKVIGGD